MKNHPDTQRVVELVNLMDSYPTPHVFVKQELNYNHEDRANTLQSVARHVCSIVEGVPIASEEAVLKQWAIQAELQDYRTLNIRGFGLAGFQYLRMLFGAQTTKPDIYIRRFVSDILNRKVSDVKSLYLLEAASKRIGLLIRTADNFIWNRGARGTGAKPAVDIQIKNTARSEYNSEYSEFWEPIRREGLFQGKPVHAPSFIKTINGIYLVPELRSHRCQIRMSFEGENRSEHRSEIKGFFPESKYKYEYKESPKFASVIFPVLDKGIKDRGNWDEMREKLVSMGTDIYNKINESDT